MITVISESDLRAHVAAFRRAGERVAFVPTMGALHSGHLSLVEIGRRHADRLVASVFVNPTQFGPNEDFSRYPRQLAQDSEMLASAGCDLLFAPEVETIYPPGHTTFVDLGEPSLGLEGEHRPGHFRGVATVVCGLLNLVQPDVAVFGEKDAQQLAVIRRMVRDLHLPVEIVPGPTIREADGLALSSRNAYLSAAERHAAGVLFRALSAAAGALAAGERRGGEIRRILHETLATEPLARVEYAEVVDAETFRPLEVLTGRLVLPMTVRIGATRLIDNFQISLPD